MDTRKKIMLTRKQMLDFFRTSDTKGFLEAMRALKGVSANINTANSDGVTLVYMAAEKDYANSIHELYAAGANVNIARHDGATPIFIAAQEGHTETIYALCAAGANINSLMPDGLTPIHIAASKGRSGVIYALCAAGANVNSLMPDGQTPIHIAAGKGHVAAIRALYVAGANVNAVSSNGETPLFIAAREGHVDVIDELYAAGANVNTVSYGVTPVWIAALGGHVKAIRALHTAGADINTPRSDGVTPVHIAAQRGHADAICVLHLLGADVNTSMSNGVTPLHVAAFEGNLGVIDALIAAGADVNVLDTDDLTPLYIASEKGHSKIVAALLKAGAEAQIKIKIEGCTALEIAKQRFEKNRKQEHLAVIEVFATHSKEVEQRNKQIAKKAKKQKQKQNEQEKALIENEKRERMQGKNLFLDSLSTKDRELEQIKNQTKSLEDKRKDLKVEIFSKNIVMTEKLVQTLEGRKNNERLRLLEKNALSLEEWVDLDHQIKIQKQKVEMAIKHFSQLVKGLESGFSGKENMMLQEKFSVFSKVGEALTGEINNSKNEILKTALVDFQAEWTLLQREQRALLELIRKLEILSQSLTERQDLVNGFRLGKDNGVLTKDVLHKISEIATRIQKTIANQKEFDSASQAAEALARATKKSLPRSALQTALMLPTAIEPNQDLREAANVHTRESIPQVLEGAISKTTSNKEDRRLAYARMRAKQMEDLKINTERAAIDFHRSRTAAEIEARQVPIPGCKKEEKITLEQSPLLKMYLQSLGLLIARLRHNHEWQPEELYALLGNLGQVNEIIVQERKHDAIARIAKRLRNAIFKQHKVIQTKLNSVQLWEMAACWHEFLQTEQISIFENEEAILQNLKSDSLRVVYALGKNLDIEAKTEDEHWAIVTANIDIHKSINYIKQMQAYWKGREVRKSDDDLINYAADDFYWAIMGSELVALTEARRQGKAGAANALRRFKSLTPYLSEFRDRGVFSRHPLTRLAEERSNMLLAIKNADDSFSPWHSLPESQMMCFSPNVKLHLNPVKKKEIFGSEINTPPEYGSNAQTSVLSL
ncbi:MAG TPA: ankyrin repeat domain-containing protein [Gammaproteobacteria bacterium]|nr:ankyrin repeat domain-containing protein [Gammaproteobacteria bacterium]